MHLSQKTKMAVSVLADLAAPHGTIPAAGPDIAQRLQISVSYLETIMRSLRDAGYVKAVRGAGGGYILDCDPSEVTVADVAGALEDFSQDFAPIGTARGAVDMLCAQAEASAVDVFASASIAALTSKILPDHRHKISGNKVHSTRSQSPVRPLATRSMPSGPNSAFDLASNPIGQPRTTGPR